MSRTPVRAGLRLLGCVAALSSAAPLARAADASPLRPPNLKPALDSPEAGLWGVADKAETYAKSSAELDKDPQLNAYVGGVVCKVAPDYCGELRVYVLDRPFFQAETAPNGYVEVWSGLLLRAQTEDELAFVLGHEISHFARNHSIQQWRAQKTTANVVLALELGVSAGASVAMYSAASTGSPGAVQQINSISRAAQSVNDLIYLSGMASLFAYSREQETEADRLGFGRAVAAGYDKTAPQRVWTYEIAESQASDFPDVRRSQVRASVFTTHPLDGERLEALRALAGAPAAAPEIAAEQRYRAAIRPHLGEWLKDDLRRRDYGETLFLIDRLEQLGDDLGVLEFYRAEAFRQRRGPGDVEAALKGYQAAVSHADAPAAAWRELGEGLRKAGDGAAAAQALAAYVAKAPDAEDRWIIESELKRLNGDGIK